VHKLCRSRGRFRQENGRPGQFELPVEKIMEQLPVQQRLIIQMRDIEQYEFHEIAKYSK
jgi:DNA-directed RNA polymerase specialized sigma24 family protein